MCFLEIENGEVMHDSYALMKDARCFYDNLYASRENETVNLETWKSDKHTNTERRGKQQIGRPHY